MLSILLYITNQINVRINQHLSVEKFSAGSLFVYLMLKFNAESGKSCLQISCKKSCCNFVIKESNFLTGNIASEN